MRSSSRHAWVLCLSTASLVAFNAGCRGTGTPKRPTPEKVRGILVRVGPLAESSLYTCLLNGYHQGLPLSQVTAECETQLAIDDERGFGPGGSAFGGSLSPTSPSSDPDSVSASCSSGNPTIGRGPDGSTNVQKNYMGGPNMKWGSYSWGGDCASKSNCYRGLSEEKSKTEKLQNIKAAEDDRDAYERAKAELHLDPDNAEKQAAFKAAEKAVEESFKKAMQDPNKDESKPSASEDPPTLVSTEDPPTTGTTGRPTGPGETPCEGALIVARELLRECIRTGWRSAKCQSFLAKMHGCAEPMIAFVDPESGYACGQKLDPEAAKDAWVKRCRELKRPTPGGPDPCAPPGIDPSGRFVTTNSAEDVCNSPISIVDPDNPACIGTITLETSFGWPHIQEVLVLGLDRLGGPVLLLHPKPKPPPGQGPEPEPGPGPVPP
jgi:hypothetical protein